MIRINMPAMRATTGVMWAAVITMAFPGFAEIRKGQTRRAQRRNQSTR
jgi:hypothetical protein